MTKKKYYIGVSLLIIVFSAMIMCGYYFYNLHFRGMTITNIAKIQANYPQFMVDINDEFIGYMIKFEEMAKDPQRTRSEEEIKAMGENLDMQNEVMIKLQKNPPNTDNKDYLAIYKDYLKLYAFFIQGEVMRVEYIAAYKDEYTVEEIQDGLAANEENYIIGVELCNMMGSMILENPIIVNKVHNTNATSIYDVIPLKEWQEEVSQKIEEYENSLQEDTSSTQNTTETNNTNNDVVES